MQLSLQDVEAANADRIAGYKGGHARKLKFAEQVVETAGLPLTINAVIHRQNIDSTEKFVALAVQMGAKRIELAHAQYYGWALANRAALMPTRAQAWRPSNCSMNCAGAMTAPSSSTPWCPTIMPGFPKACVGGWGRRVINVTPTGKVLPCHAAETIPGLVFDNVRDKPLAEIWRHSAAFNAFRGTDWMLEPCRSCDARKSTGAAADARPWR